MPVTAEESAPYTSQGVMLSLLERNRDRGLPNPLTPDRLQQLGVPDSLIPRTLQALRTLDLIREDGAHTEVLDRLRRAPEAEYQPLMAEWLKAAYAHALDVIDPATADETAVRDAFRNYNPISMQPRMITLFTALFEAAGVRPAAQKAAAAKKGASQAAPRPARQPVRAPRAPQSPAAPMQPIGTLHPAIAGLIASLPTRGWTKDSKDRFLAALGAVLDVAIPIIESEPIPEVSNGNRD